MKRRKKPYIAAALLLAACVTASLTIMAATSSGTQSDPLVTLSYLNEKFTPQIKTELQSELETAKGDLARRFDESVSSGAQRPTSPEVSEADVFSVVTLSRGQSVKCSVGVELLLRIGTATAAGEAPGLVDSTQGATLASGGGLTANHLYMVTIEGNGIKATADTVKVMIRGSYTVT
ncbi:MAG: hypothetical protein LBS51_00720 [Oscillospiraceae bacterium]|jgi:hypothetical protein|nr:hypothetical protein [Oscillospiraceae bacterium]